MHAPGLSRTFFMFAVLLAVPCRPAVAQNGTITSPPAVPPATSASQLVAGNIANGPAEMPQGDNLPNINQTPKVSRISNLEKTWPAKPGDAAVCLWADDKTAAWSIEIDDNYAEDIPWWEEQSQKRGGLPLTWFVITGLVGKYPPHTGTWDVFKRLQNEGFRLESHTVTHFAKLPADWPGLEWDYTQSIKDLDTNLPNHTTRFLAYPGGANPNPNDRDMAAKHFAAARGTGGTPMAAGMVDYLNTNGFHPIMGNPKAQWTDPTNVLTPVSPSNKIFQRGWANMFWHGINRKVTDPMDALSEPCALAVLDFLTAHKDELWGSFYGDVAMYGQERDTATLTTVSAGADKIVLKLTGRMDPAVFTYPLTLKVRLPDGWPGATATQKGQSTPTQRLDHDGAHFALVKAVPGQGDVTLTPAR